MTQHQKKQDAILIGSEDDSSDEAEATTPMLSTCLKASIKRCYSDSECDGGPHSGYVTPAPTNKCSEFSGDDDDDDDGKDCESEYEPLKSQAIKMEPVTPRMTLCHRRGHGAVSRDEVGGMKRHHCSEEEGEEGDTSLTTTSGTPLPKRSRSGHLNDRSGHLNDGTEEDSDHHAGELGPDELSTEHCEVDEGNSDHATYDVFLGIFTPDLVPRSRDTVPRSRGTVSGSHDTPFRRKASCDSTTTTTPRRLLTGGRRKSQLVSARPSKARDDPPVSRDHPHVSRELKISDTPPGSPETPPTAASSSVLVMSPMLSHVLLEGSVAWGPAGSSGGSCLVPSGGFGSYGDGTLHAACKSPMPPPAHQCHVSTRLRSSPSPSSPEPNSTGQPSGCSATPTGLLCSTSPPGCYPPPVHSSIKHHTPCVLSSPGLCFSQCSHHPHHCTAALLSCCCCCCCCRHHCRCHLHTCHTHSHLPSPPPHSHQVNGAVTPHAVG